MSGPENQPDALRIEWIFCAQCARLIESCHLGVVPWCCRETGMTLAPATSLSSGSVWKNIKLGALSNDCCIGHPLSAAGMRLSLWGDDLCRHAAYVNGPEMVAPLIAPTVRELGFKTAVPRRSIIRRALGDGLRLCRVDVGPHLRLQYPDQPRGEWIIVAMEPLRRGAYYGVFAVGHGLRDGTRWLDGHTGHDDALWHPNQRFVFVLPTS